MAHAESSLSPVGTLLDQLLPSRQAGRAVWVRNALAIIAGSVLLTLSAKASIPFYPVPLTFQTMVVLALGMVLGPRLGAAAVIAYLAQGALGIPVFAGTPEKGIGLAYMMGTTGGYLVGFVIAAFVTGLLAERHWDRSFMTTVAAMVIGNAIIYLCGLAWLGSLIGWDKPVLALGMTPFLLGDLAKILMVAAILPTLWKTVK
ncbi:MAG: biotin transporter BioY [Granulosicoccus sp.]|nr:biotin transporter BioY [Granulosicoccus sp.]